jgi:lipid-binding SYLF domain-containing protein
MQRILVVLAALIFTLSIGPAARAELRTDQRLAEAQRVLDSFVNLNEEAIPSWLLDRAYGIVIVPRVIKGAIIFGGRGGKGVMAVRNPDGSWSNPVFVTLGGASVGLQWGVQATDVILVLMSRKSVEGIAGGKVTLGADASVAAGPLGRTAGAATDATLKAQVLSYSRSEGLFLGASLEGSVIAVDDKSNELAYGVAGIRPSQILEGKVADAPPTAGALVDSLSKATRPAAASATAPQDSSNAPPQPRAAPTESTPEPRRAPEGAKTFPLEDTNPGAPPPQ